MVTFKTAPTVAPGDAVTSSEMRSLADAVNDRIKSGFGDATRRIHFYLSSIWRQVRNPDSSGFLFPPVDEFRQVYEHFSPNEYTWPLTGPGEPEGTNVSSIMGSFVFGNETLNVGSEDARLSDPIEGGVDLDFGTGTAFELWELAKRQRGAIDVSTGVIASPVLDAAKSHFAIIQSARSMHGNAYGGYIPTPEYIGACGDPAEDGTYQLIFTPVVDGLPTLTFEGFCESEPTHVSTILRYPGDRYVVVQNNGTITTLDWAEYIEGPYQFGNRLTKTWGNNLSRVLNFYASEFSGTPTQKADEDAGGSAWLSHAFTTHEFLTTQYHLAPQRGIQTGEYVQPIYPEWKAVNTTAIASGTVIARSSGASGETFATSAGHVTASVMVRASGLIGATTITIKDGESVLGSVRLESSTDSKVLTFPARVCTALQFVLGSDAAFTSSSSTNGLFCEATELWSYKPTLWDLALLLRLCGGRIETYNGTDGSGLDEDQAKEIGEDYFANGVIVNRRLHIALPGSAVTINENAVFDAARRMGREWSRLIPRQQLIGYEVGSDGKSVLYFRRLWSGNSAADVFHGIAPDIDPIESGNIEKGRSYTVFDGAVTYNGTAYSVGQSFTGTAGKTEFQTVDGHVYESNGIVSEALEAGWSNEWVMDVMSLIPYQTLDTSVWKVDAFTDYVSTFFDRCTWQAPTPLPKDLTYHFSYGSGDWVAPESFPSFRYIGSGSGGINTITCAALDTACEAERRKKLRSCPVGELPLVVEKTERLFENGEEVVKVTLSGRLQHGTDATSTIDRDYTTWSLATIQAENESGRTAENGIREYIINQFVGGNCIGPGTQYGNAGHESLVATSLDVPFGACYPRIAFTKLIPKPYEDNNNEHDSSDTPMESFPFAQIETYARSMCEGYVDTVSTELYGCATGTYAVLDYTFENACFSAFGGRAFGCIQSATTSITSSAEVRSDKPLFHGPLPNTYPSAEIFNQFSSFFNQLTSIRLMLPIDFQTKFGTSETVEVKKMYTADGTEVSCSTTAVNPGVFNTFSPVQPSTPSMGSYASASLASGQYQISIDPDDCDGSGDWRLVHTRRDESFKWSLLHDDYLEAIPESWRDMIESNGLLLGIRETLIAWTNATYVSATNGTACNHPAPDADFWSGSGGEVVLFVENSELTTECKLLPFSETLTAPLPPPCAIGVGREYNAGTLYDCPINASSTLTVTPIPADALIIRADLA